MGLETLIGIAWGFILRELLSFSHSVQNSCCLGSPAKSQSQSGRAPRAPQRRDRHRKRSRDSRQRTGQWSSSPVVMDSKASNSRSVEALSSHDPAYFMGEIRVVDESQNDNRFVNHAEIAWHEQRKEWVGDRSKKSSKVPREPIISWCTTYDDLLATNQPFPQPIPLSEMVDFLVDVWHEEGLYD